MNKPLILVVEDDTSVKNLITTTLKTHDYRYLTVSNGATAIMDVASHNPDIVLLDLGLPDMDGLDVIKRSAPGPTFPFWSSAPEARTRTRSKRWMQARMITSQSPFSVEELLARLRVTQRRLAMMQNGLLRRLRFSQTARSALTMPQAALI